MDPSNDAHDDQTSNSPSEDVSADTEAPTAADNARRKAESEKRAERHRQDLALAHYNHIEQQVALAATTAGLIVAANALLISAVLGIADELNVSQDMQRLYLFFVALGMSLAGLLIALYAAMPSVRFSSETPPVENVYFFGRIAVWEFEDYYRSVQAMTEEEMDRELLYQVHGKSKWLRRIFVRTRCAILFTVLGALLSMSLVALTTARIL